MTKMENIKPILITGASRGLGAAMAEVLAAPNRHIIAVARTTGALEELDDRIQNAGGSATLAPMDVTDAGAMAHLCNSIHQRWGGLSGWIHCAIHVPPLSPADHIDEKDFAKSIDLNVTATSRLITFVAPLLSADDAQAVFVEDRNMQSKFSGAYSASKAAQIALAKAWAAECERTGPKISIVAPKPMPTATRARFFPGEDRASLTPPIAEAKRILAELGL